MGKDYHGGFLHTRANQGAHAFADNLTMLLEGYDLTKDGYFGHRGKHATPRHMLVRDPQQMALDFACRAAGGYVSKKEISGRGAVYTMKDGVRIIYRENSASDGTPVVEIRGASGGRVKPQKIHFIKEQ